MGNVKLKVCFCNLRRKHASEEAVHMGDVTYVGDFEFWVECMFWNIPGRIYYGSEILDWVLFMMTMWDLLAQPHSSIP
jgi:hypothetical protein